MKKELEKAFERHKSLQSLIGIGKLTAGKKKAAVTQKEIQSNAKGFQKVTDIDYTESVHTKHIQRAKYV